MRATDNLFYVNVAISAVGFLQRRWYQRRIWRTARAAHPTREIFNFRSKRTLKIQMPRHARRAPFQFLFCDFIYAFKYCIDCERSKYFFMTLAQNMKHSSFNCDKKWDELDKLLYPCVNRPRVPYRKVPEPFTVSVLKTTQVLARKSNYLWETKEKSDRVQPRRASLCFHVSNVKRLKNTHEISSLSRKSQARSYTTFVVYEVQ